VREHTRAAGGCGAARDFLKGSLLGTTIRVKFWRVPFGEIPKDHEGRVRWLYEWWKRVDEWTGALSG